MISIGIFGATGYAGVELVRLLTHHPQAHVVALVSQNYEGKEFSSVYPHLAGQLPAHWHTRCVAPDLAAIVRDCDLIFIAMPHGHAVPIAQAALQAGKKVIDLGADFRFKNATTYETWYRVKHTAPDLLARAVYGLPELNRVQIANASLVANPGCYPTATTLALAPLIRQGCVALDSLVVDAKSGVSGAGRSANVDHLYVEANDSIRAYGVTSHRHTPEIEQNLENLAQQPLQISFTPHLTPMTRGILATAYARLNTKISVAELRELYRQSYDQEQFVTLLAEEQWPRTKWVYGSNQCQVNIAVDLRVNRVIALAAIDNLVKGAAGQAIQNMNIMFGLAEETALSSIGLFP